MSRLEKAEARATFEFFTGASEGAAVIDGTGRIWQHSGGRWYSKGHPASPVASMALAKALNPNLEEELAKLAQAVPS